MAEKKPSIWNIRRYLPEEDVNTVDKQGLTKIFQAAQKGKSSDMRTLIEKALISISSFTVCLNRPIR